MRPNRRFGRHYPNGAVAVDYIYGADGTWRRNAPAEYLWNYYDYSDNPLSHPFDKSQLLEYADGTRFTTARDADGHLLLDFDHDGVIDTQYGGYAFYEHNGKGKNGQAVSKPFTQFWFDDNWLARFMSEAYQREHPYGLSEYSDFTRWRILSGDTAAWRAYSGDQIDQLALTGLYYLAGDDIQAAIDCWDAILAKSSWYYDHSTQQFIYSSIHTAYHLALFHIFTRFLMDATSDTVKEGFMQHWVSLRSCILSNQERHHDRLYGWRSDRSDPLSLMNTESIVLNILALGAGAVDVFEAGHQPMKIGNTTFFARPHNILSAVTGLSTPGFMTFGPYWTYSTGSYSVELYLRSPAADSHLATLDVFDAANSHQLAKSVISGSHIQCHNNWETVAMDFEVKFIPNNLEFRVFWHGNTNLDVACIRIVER